MKMDDEKLKRILQEAAEWDADQIMEQVNSDPAIRDLEAPELIHENLFHQIHEHEASKQDAESALTEEQKEYIRLGKKYEKKLSRRKYYVLLAAVVCGLAAGMVSFGDGKKVFSEMKRVLSDREQTVVNTENDSKSFKDEIATEEEAFQEIEETFGLWAVRMSYLPEGMEFVEASVEEEKQGARLYYVGDNEQVILYYVTANTRVGSIVIDIEDELISEHEQEKEGILVKVQEYKVDKTNTKRWVLNFVYNSAQYSIMISGVSDNEVEKVIDNILLF